jgi:predicted PurR-regulated permease PerM
VVGKFALEGIGAIALTLAVALYLLLEGKELYAWLVSFVPRSRRDRVAQTAEEVSRVVLAYMRGQVITSVLCALYVSGVLLLLRVPAALLLGLLAGILDIIPVVGTILLIALPALVASTISPGRGLLVLLALSFYHVIESYLIVPRVYGKQMRLSALTVLLAVTVGGALQGIAGMVLILPLVAAYPIVERLWLRPLVGSDTVTDHQRLEHDQTGQVADDITRT